MLYADNYRTKYIFLQLLIFSGLIKVLLDGVVHLDMELLIKCDIKSGIGREIY
jgi:hypothetical protein